MPAKPSVWPLFGRLGLVLSLLLSFFLPSFHFVISLVLFCLHFLLFFLPELLSPPASVNLNFFFHLPRFPLVLLQILTLSSQFSIRYVPCPCTSHCKVAHLDFHLGTQRFQARQGYSDTAGAILDRGSCRFSFWKHGFFPFFHRFCL